MVGSVTDTEERGAGEPSSNSLTGVTLCPRSVLQFQGLASVYG